MSMRGQCSQQLVSNSLGTAVSTHRDAAAIACRVASAASVGGKNPIHSRVGRHVFHDVSDTDGAEREGDLGDEEGKAHDRLLAIHRERVNTRTSGRAGNTSC